MKRHRTALGKMIDMSELVAKNEKTRAVGNMRVNARGDTIDSSGKILEPVTSKVNNGYSKTVGNKSAQPVRQQPRQVRKGNDPGSPMKNGGTVPVHPRHMPPPPPPEPVQPELTEAEKELEQELMDDVEVENIKARESE